jgi:hypothetical protein
MIYLHTLVIAARNLEGMHRFQHQVMVFSSQIYMLIQNVGNHSSMTNFNIREDTNPRMHALQFTNKHLQAISKTFITQESLLCWKTTEDHILFNIQVFWYITLRHQVSTFQRIEQLSSSGSGSQRVPFVTKIDLTMRHPSPP